MKSKRQEAILRIITENEVQTQEALQQMLKDEGFKVTQATVSRDIKSLSLTKAPSGRGKSRYVQEKATAQLQNSVKFRSVFMEAVIAVDYGQNIVAVKCHVGMGNAACAALDSMEIGDVVGTLAGDDTIFVLLKTNKEAEEFTAKIRQMLVNK